MRHTTLRSLRAAAALKKKRQQRPKKAKKALRKAIKGVINSQAETKMVAFYGGPVAGTTPPQNSNGLYADAAPVSQNQFITSNVTDILKVLPDVAPGSADNQRAGRFINPVSCNVRCKVMISPTTTGTKGWTQGYAYDLTIVAYLLQHVSYKTYRSLYTDNAFDQMLDVMDGTTTHFDGSFQGSTLPVEKGYYKVLSKKTKRLRSSGTYPFAIPPTVPAVSNQNSAPQVHEWTWNVGKHLPKKLIYPEASVSVNSGQNEPLNAAPFWCVGYYNTDGSVASTGVIDIQQEYTSIMKFKDF